MKYVKLTVILSYNEPYTASDVHSLAIDALLESGEVNLANDLGIEEIKRWRGREPHQA
jgi:hypothetical protein